MSGDPLPEPMRLPLAELVELLVERDYEALAQRSEYVRSAALRSRMEEDYRVDLAVPPPEHYTWEALTLLDEGPPRRWDVFLDLWDGERIADLHLTATLDEVTPGRFTARLEDVAP